MVGDGTLYSVACRAITKGEMVLHRGHGGRWSDVPASPKRRPAPCPVCNRPMVQTGEIRTTSLREDDRSLDIEAPSQSGSDAR